MSTTPDQTVRQTIYDVLNSGTLGCSVLQYMPRAGYPVPCVGIQQVSQTERPSSQGQYIEGGTAHGSDIQYLFQIDCYAETDALVEILADKVKKRMGAARGSFEAIPMTKPQLIAGHEAFDEPSRAYRQILEYRTMIEVKFT